MASSLLQLMSEGLKGDIVLPDIQRSFVWSQSQICELFDSLFRGYPVGSFLFWKAIGSDDTDQRIIFHNFVRDYSETAGIPPQRDLTPGESKTFVLDGQQRLQSLYIALEGSYEGDELHLDLLSGFDDRDAAAGIRYFVQFFNPKSLERFVAKNPGRKMVRVKDFVRLPPAELARFRTHALVGRYGFAAGTLEHVHAMEVVNAVHQSLSYPERVPVIRIDENAATAAECSSLDEVAEIFVRVNDGGTKLSRSDLIFSLMKAKWVGASEEIQALCDELNKKGEFEVTKDFVLRCLMVFSGRSAKYDVSQIRKSDVMLQFKAIFPKAKKAIQSTFDFLVMTEGAGIRTWRLLSGGQRADRGYNALIPIGLFLFLRSAQEIPEKDRRALRRFLYTAILSRYPVRYVESRIDALAKVVRGAHERAQPRFPVSECIAKMAEAELFTEPEELVGRANTLDPLLNILAGGGVDFSTLLDRNRPERDHIFPKSKLEGLGMPPEKVNHFANMRLLGKLPNIQKSAEDPELVFAGVKPESLMQDYLIPAHLLKYDDFERFLDERTQLIRKRVSQYLSEE